MRLARLPQPFRIILFLGGLIVCAATGHAPASDVARLQTGPRASVALTSMGEEDLVFSEIVIKTDPMPMSVVIADFNNDGFADFALLNEDSGLMWTYKSLQRSRHFVAGTIYLETSLHVLAAGDFNNDGNIDLCVSRAQPAPFGGESARDILTVRLGDGTGLFPDKRHAFDLYNSASMALGDFNNDGHLDVVAARNAFINVILGYGSRLGPTEHYTAGGGFGDAYSDLEVGDFDGDGDLDIVATDPRAGEVSILFGGGEGAFWTRNSFATGSRPSAAAVGDFNGDGHLDMAVTNEGGNDLVVMLGDGAGGVLSTERFACGNAPAALAPADIDVDGHLDLIVANRGDNDVSIFLGSGTGAFSRAADISVGQGPTTLALGDCDGDGFLDIVVANTAGGTTSILFREPSSDPNTGYGGGSGTPDDPYRIWTPVQLDRIGSRTQDWDKHFVLMKDIDLVTFSSIGIQMIGGRSGKEFNGLFDGNGHTITNFTYTQGSHADIKRGFFGTVGPDGRIVNLGLVNAHVQVVSWHGVGALAGWNHGSISNCYATGRVSGDIDVGGLVGFNDGTISDCSATGECNGDECVGGVAGRNGGTVLRCRSGSAVFGGPSVGGLVGRSDETGSVSESCTSCIVQGSSDVGGLVGTAEGPVSYCYASGDVSGTERVGGLVGANSGTILGCYSRGNVSANSHAGGLIGYNSGRVYLSFWDAEASQCLDSDGGRGRRTAEMMQATTYRGWGHDAAWTLDEGNDYPKLVWQHAAGVPIVDAPGGYGGGTGTPEEPYEVWTAEQMDEIGTNPYDWDGHFLLMADIDLSGFADRRFNMAGEEAEDNSGDKPFVGVFDGNGHRVVGFTYRADREQANVGLFSYVGSGGQVKKLTLVDVAVDSAGDNVGALAGHNLGTISDCNAAGIVSGHHEVGGLIGNNSGGLVTDCHFDGVVTGIFRVGGLAGHLLGERLATVSDCDVTGTISGHDEVGGVIGANQGGTLIECCFEGSVAGGRSVGGIVGSNGDQEIGPHSYVEGQIINCSSTQSDIAGDGSVGGIAGWNGHAVIAGCYSRSLVTGGVGIGGLVGENQFGAVVGNSYATGGVTGQEGVGGLVGINGGEDQWAHGEIVNCYSVASVAGDIDAGGLVGINLRGEIAASFWDVQTSGQSRMCGFQTYAARGCHDSYGRTTAEMQNPATFIDGGWNFERPIWVIQPQDYPTLAWTAPDADGPPSVSGRVFAVSIGMGHKYGYPDDPADAAYEFWLEVLTDASVEKVEFFTPGGETCEIFRLQEREEPILGGQRRTECEVDAESCAFEWDYEVQFESPASLRAYGNGDYTLVVYYAGGKQDQTTVWFGVPGTNEPIVQPTQQPTFTSFANGESLSSPVRIDWEPSVHPTVNIVHVRLENDETGQEEGEFFDAEATGMPQPVVLTEGFWQARLAFGTLYNTQNADGIDLELVKYSESEYVFTVVPGP
ncbi:MAG: VCBS repeat-containing protein [Sedimentisphaerales bacterium]|nr:VCBS repeat-containing protein [Sedimentisphaerales bacterium]